MLRDGIDIENSGENVKGREGGREGGRVIYFVERQREGQREVGRFREICLLKRQREKQKEKERRG